MSDNLKQQINTVVPLFNGSIAAILANFHLLSIMQNPVYSTIILASVGYFTTIILKTLFVWLNKKLKKWLKITNKDLQE